MTRAVPASLQAALDAGATTLCDCWRIDRTDGVSQGFTDHDEPVSFDGVTFEADAGFTGSATVSGLGLAIGGGEVEGALRSDALSAEDLAAGLYDGARVRRWRVDWRDPASRMQTFSGFLGRIERGAHGFTAELDGLTAALNRRTGRAFLPQCDAELGDARCGVDLAAPGRRVPGTVASVEGACGFVAALGEAVAAGWAEHGRVRWESGRNAGRVSAVRAQPSAGASPAVELWASPPFAVTPGDAFTLEIGCDRRAEMCAGRFANIANFRGFPHIPGEGWLTAGPQDGEPNDGGRRG